MQGFHDRHSAGPEGCQAVSRYRRCYRRSPIACCVTRVSAGTDALKRLRAADFLWRPDTVRD